MKKSYLIASLALPLILSSCAKNQHMPLIFGQSQTVGISIGASTADQGADFTLGYEDKNIALVPIAISDKDGNMQYVGSSITDENNNDVFEDAYSVLGQFKVQTSTNAQGNAGLGKFFATGGAAKTLADGFSCQLAPNSTGCNAANQGQ